MYIYEIERPNQALKDFHPNGTTVTLKLDYGECILLDHALHEYEKTHPNMTDEDKYFKWQFIFLRDILKNGNIDGFWCGVYAETFPSKNAEVEKALKDSEVEK